MADRNRHQVADRPVLTLATAAHLIWWKLAVHRVGDATMVPTRRIVLGPLGQSINAAGPLG